MSTGLCQPNTTQIPNEVFDHWMATLTPAQFKVLLCICRKTYGWQKMNDCISLRQIKELTGLGKAAVINGLKSLEDHGLIVKHKSKTEWGDDAPNMYEIKVRDGSKPDGGGYSDNTTGGILTIPGVVSSGDTQKKLYTKETNTKEESHPSGALSEKDFRRVDFLFSKVKEADPKAKEPNREKWAQEIERMHRLDGRSYEEIDAIIRFAHSDPFWSSNILCAFKLRQKATRLIAKMRNGPQSKSEEEDKEKKKIETAHQFIETHAPNFTQSTRVNIIYKNGIEAAVEIKKNNQSEFIKFNEGGLESRLDNFRRTFLSPSNQGAIA